MAIPLPTSDIYQRLGITAPQLAAFCQQWQVAELSFFGSILRDDFSPNSDVDILVAYLPTADRGLFQKIRMKEDLQTLLGRKVDLVSKSAIQESRNWLRRQNILTSAQVVYVA